MIRALRREKGEREMKSATSTLAVLVAIACSLLASCGSKRDELPPPPPVETAGSYALQPGDRIDVKFYHNPELNEENVVVRPDGMITVQLIGDVPAAGRAPSEVSRALEEEFTGELANPKIAVIVRGLWGNRVFVGGQVKEPQAVRLRAGLTLFQAIQEAGGLEDSANDKVVLIRRDGAEPIGYLVDLQPILDGDDPGQDVLLTSSDIVHVPRSGIADANLVVEQYIRNMLPVQPGFAIPIP